MKLKEYDLVIVNSKNSKYHNQIGLCIYIAKKKAYIQFEDYYTGINCTTKEPQQFHVCRYYNIGNLTIYKRAKWKDGLEVYW